MKLIFIISVCVVILCVRESDGLQLIQKLKNILHPTQRTVISTTVRPTIPAYEKKNGLNSDEDSSMSQSQENQEDSFHKDKYISIDYNKRKPYNREETTETNSFGDLKTTTKAYNIGYQPDKDYGTYKKIPTTTTESTYGGSYSSKSTTSSGGLPNNDIPSSTSKSAQDTWIEAGLLDQRTTTITPGGSGDENNDKLSAIGGSNSDLQSTTSRSASDFNGNNNIPNQYGGVDDITSTTQRIPQGNLDSFDYFSQSTTGRNSYISQSYGSQPEIYGDGGIDTAQSTTLKDNDIGDFGETPDNSPSSGNFGNENPSNNKQGPSSYNYFTTKPTTTYDATDLNNVQPGMGNNYNTDSSGTSFPEKGGNYNNPSESNPSYSKTQGSNKKNIEGSDGGKIIFPDDPSLQRNEENERIFGESKSYHSSNNTPSVQNNVHPVPRAPVPVPVDGGKAIINAPSSLSSRKPA